MNDSVTLNSAEASEAQDASAGESAGSILRKAREAAGMHVAALAVAMKVPVKKLEALEGDRLDLLPDAVFVRALASSMCRALKIDSAPVLAKLPQTSVPRLDTDERGINAPFYTPGGANVISFTTMLLRPSTLAVLVLLVGIVTLIFLPDLQKNAHLPQMVQMDTPSVTVSTPVEIPAPTPAEPLREVLNEPAPVLVAAPVQGAAAVPTVEKPPVVVTAPEPTKTNVLNDRTEVGKVSSGAPVAGNYVVVFKVRGPSWVEVVDASGAVQLRRNLAAGDSAGASGSLPLAVVVGRADVTDVEVRGKPLPLTSVTKENVARFEVK
jgi:cytoskeleton protein RodZ